jgi:hypothetical protein
MTPLARRYKDGRNMPGQSQDPSALDQMHKALALMREALDLLDGARAPAHLGAHLDLAIVRLAESIPAATTKGELPPAAARPSQTSGSS